jgi:gamma-glutamyltranspeptidase / glutathione hydrolase
MAPTQGRPAVRASRYAVSSGHYLATAAGQRVFEQGGNAIDAGVAAGVALNVLLPEWTGIGGVAPMLVLDGRDGSVASICGLGRWPRATDVGALRERWGGRIPPGVWRAVTPAAMGAWLVALQRYGRLPLGEVLAPAIELAERGTPVHAGLAQRLTDARGLYGQWPATVEVFYPGGDVPAVGARLYQPDLARTLRRLVAAADGQRDRAAGIAAAYERFYCGDVAREVAAFFEQEGGWLRYEDLAEFEVAVEAPVATEYRGYTVYSCGPWCQGPTVLQTLNVLEGERLAALEHNSAEYVHLVTEALKLAFADRGAYYGDPEWVRVPLAGLLSKEYAAVQRSRLDAARCAPAEPAPGDPWPFEPGERPPAVALGRAGPLERGTSYVCAADAEGNALSATPSDGILTAPIVPGLGFAVSSRGVQSWLDPSHPSAVQPGKRPLLTPNPGLAMRDGRLFMVYGTPGTDTQPQAMVQLLANVIDFGLDAQAAVEAPRFATYSFPRANDPHEVEAASLYLEARIAPAVAEALRARGHDVRPWPAYTSSAGELCAIVYDPATETLIGAADLRRLCYAAGW